MPYMSIRKLARALREATTTLNVGLESPYSPNSRAYRAYEVGPEESDDAQEWSAFTGYPCDDDEVLGAQEIQAKKPAYSPRYRKP